MKFEKKLIILSGENDAKGTLTLERNAYGTFATFNIYNLKNLEYGEYVVGLKDNENVFTRKVGLMGRIVSRFEIDNINLDKVHCVIYDTLDEKPVMYGTNDAKRLWHGNMMDGLKSKKLEFPVALEKEEIEAALPAYSKRSDNIENYFLDILPKNDAAYIDTAVAAVNYYPDKMNIEVKYSKRDDEAIDFTNPVDRAEKNLALEREQVAATLNTEQNNIGESNIDENQAEQDEMSGIVLEQHENIFCGQQSDEDDIKEQQSETTDKHNNKTQAGKEQDKTDKPFCNDTERIVNAAQIDENIKIEESKRLFDNAVLKDKLFRKNQTVSDSAQEKSAENIGSNKTEQNKVEQKKSEQYKTEQNNAGNTIKEFGTVNKTAKEASKTVEKAAVPRSEVKVSSAASESAATVPPLENGAYVGQQNMESVFYEQIKAQLDDLFTTNPKFEALEKLLPETKWTKVDYDNSGKFYVVGLIGAKPDYVCYGVPATYTPDAPQELSGYCQWLPLDETKPTGEGFWLMFQDAVSGESIKQTEEDL